MNAGLYLLAAELCFAVVLINWLGVVRALIILGVWFSIVAFVRFAVANHKLTRAANLIAKAQNEGLCITCPFRPLVESYARESVETIIGEGDLEAFAKWKDQQ